MEKERGGEVGKESIAVMLALSQVLLTLFHLTQGDGGGEWTELVYNNQNWK